MLGGFGAGPFRVAFGGSGAGRSGAMVVEKNESLEADSKVKKVDVKTEYTLGRVLGKGAFAKVHIGRNIKDPKMERAVKVVDLGHADARTIGKLATEVRTMRRAAASGKARAFGRISADGAQNYIGSRLS